MSDDLAGLSPAEQRRELEAPTPEPEFEPEPGRPTPVVPDAVFCGEFTVAQIKAAAEMLIEGNGMDPRVRFYALADGSIDVHQSDAVDNIERDGKRNG